MLAPDLRRKRIDLKFNGHAHRTVDLYYIFDIVPFVLLDNAVKYAPIHSEISVRGIRLTRDSWNTNVTTQKRPKCPPMEGRGFRGLKSLWHMVSRLKWIPRFL